MAKTGIGMECWRWQAVLRFMGGSCDEILEVAENWTMGSCSPGQSSMAAVPG